MLIVVVEKTVVERDITLRIFYSHRGGTFDFIDFRKYLSHREVEQSFTDGGSFQN